MMLLNTFMQSEIFLYVVLPLMIFAARIIDQSIGILRIIFATKGLRYLTLLFGFFESLIWLLAISQIIQHLDNIFCYLAFAAGFATGNFVGIYLESKLSIGAVIVRVVFQKDSAITISKLKESDFRTTTFDAEGAFGPVKVLFSTMKRKDVKPFLKILNENNPTAFYTIEDVKKVKDGFISRKATISDYVNVRK